MLHTVITWLADTHLSLIFKTTHWLVPVSQSLHILAVAIVLSAFVMLTMHSWSVTACEVPATVLYARFVPWVWIALGVLATTGVVQIIAEPGRALPNVLFQAKMVFLGVVIALLLTVSRRRTSMVVVDGVQAASSTRRITWSAILALAVAMIFCGRWIAYSSHLVH